MIKQRAVLRTLSALSFILSLSAILHAQTIFTYQGYLRQDGLPANGNFDFEFQLSTAPVGGILLGTDTELNVPVANGLFTVQLDFGEQFPGADRYIAIRVRPVGGGAYTTLAPRVPITRSPYAIRANVASSLQLPYSATLSSASSLFSLTNTGSGRAMTLSVDNAASAANTLQLSSNGNANSQVVSGVHTGLGDAALFQINTCAIRGCNDSTVCIGSVGDLEHARLTCNGIVATNGRSAPIGQSIKRTSVAYAGADLEHARASRTVIKSEHGVTCQRTLKRCACSRRVECGMDDRLHTARLIRLAADGWRKASSRYADRRSQ